VIEALHKKLARLAGGKRCGNDRCCLFNLATAILDFERPLIGLMATNLRRDKTNEVEELFALTYREPAHLTNCLPLILTLMLIFIVFGF
jgi:hypothetical protein